MTSRNPILLILFSLGVGAISGLILKDILLDSEPIKSTFERVELLIVLAWLSVILVGVIGYGMASF